MVAYSLVQASNARIRSTLGPSPTALFVGGTEGIGYTTMNSFVANTESPNIFIVGRSQQKGEKVIEEMKQVNGMAKYEFITGDFTLLESVQKACDTLLEKMKETGVDFVCLSPGYLSLGRHETKEGLDALLTIRYYARLFLVHTLLSSLPAGKRPRHVLAVLAATTEEKVNEADMALSDPANYGKLLPCAAHSSTFTSLSFEHLAKEYPDTSFVHAYPGLVKTAAITNWITNPWVRWLIEWTIVPLVTPFTVPVEEAGNRMLFYLTSQRYPSVNGKKGKADGVELVSGLESAKGEGAYLVARYSDEGQGKCMEEYRQREFGITVWNHSLQMFEEALKKSV